MRWKVIAGGRFKVVLAELPVWLGNESPLSGLVVDDEAHVAAEPAHEYYDPAHDFFAHVTVGVDGKCLLIAEDAELNASGLSSMPVTLAEGAAAVSGSSWPFIGALGAFVAGSNTVSNLTFSQFQFSTGNAIGVNPEQVVVAQAVGGAGGNPIAIHNIVAASATVGLLGREGDLLRKTILVTLYYCFAAGSISFIFIYGLGFNLGSIMLVLLMTTLGLIVRWMLRQKAAVLAPEPTRV